jgi:hypothetical protein
MVICSSTDKTVKAAKAVRLPQKNSTNVRAFIRDCFYFLFDKAKRDA